MFEQQCRQSKDKILVECPGGNQQPVDYGGSQVLFGKSRESAVGTLRYGARANCRLFKGKCSGLVYRQQMNFPVRANEIFDQLIAGRPDAKNGIDLALVHREVRRFIRHRQRC